MIGSQLACALRAARHRVLGTYHRHRPMLDGITILPMSLEAGQTIRETIRLLRPEVAVYCAGIADEARCAANQGTALAVNAEAAAVVAQEMATLGGSLIFLSSSKVFSGDRGGYREEDTTDGTSLYGRMKHQAEELLSAQKNVLTLRLGNVFGLSQFPHRTFLNRLLRDLHEGNALPLIQDELRTYYGVDEVCRAIAHLLTITPFPTGLYHLGDGGRDSYYSFSLKLAGIFGLDPSRLKPIQGAEFSKLQPGHGNRGADLSLLGEAFAKQFAFQLAPPEASLMRLKTHLQSGSW